MISRHPSATESKQGDEVALFAGAYPGTRGVFMNLRPEPHWADLRELSGRVRNHPLAWPGHWTGSDRGREFDRGDERARVSASV